MSQQYENNRREYASGWRTWHNDSVLSHVHIPDGIGVRLCIKDYSVSQMLENLYLSNQNSETTGDARTSACAYDASYTDLTVTWRQSVIRVQTALDGDDLVMLVTPIQKPFKPAALLVSGIVLWNSKGSVARKADTLMLNMPSGSVPVYTTAPVISDPYFRLTMPYVAVTLDNAVGVSTGKKRSLDEIQALIAQGRAKWEANKMQYGDWAEAYNAMQTSLAWNTVYAHDLTAPLTPVSRFWNSSFNGGYVLFCWDTYFAAMMLAFDNKSLAYSNAITITSSVEEMGFVPNFLGPTQHSSYDRSQPPVGSMACLWIYKRHKDEWFLREVYDNLIRWNQWWMDNRQTKNGLLTWGSVPFTPINGCPLEVDNVNTCMGAALESGLDNSPMYDNIEYDDQNHQLLLDDVGLSGLYIHDCRCLAEIARILGDIEKAEMLEKRAALIEENMESLWDEETGMYLNRRLTTGAFDHRLTPFHFHALFSSRAKGAHAERMVREHLLNPEEFWGDCVLPSIARNDPAWGDNFYWRGRVWGPMNFLVYMALCEHGMEDVRKELAIKSRDLFMPEWLEKGHIHENYSSAEPTGCANGSDSFYHWGALLCFIGLLEQEKNNL